MQFVPMPVFKAIRHHVKLRRIGQEMTDDGQKNLISFGDHAGYGLSDDSAQDMTAEQVISDDRAALQNAGVEAPYLLLAHSMGGKYAAY